MIGKNNTHINLITFGYTRNKLILMNNETIMILVLKRKKGQRCRKTIRAMKGGGGR